MLSVRIFAIFLLTTIISTVAAIGGGGQEKIIEGSAATAFEYPFMVSVSYGGRHICGGFIYNQFFVVTAASCVDGVSIGGLKVTGAQLSLITPDPNEQVIAAKSVTPFDGFNPVSKLHDIALIEVDRPFVLNTNVTFVRFEAIDELGSNTGSIMGWGAVEPGGLENTKLRKGTVEIFDTDCRSYGDDEYDRNYMLCVGKEDETTTPCQYDEGSPLVQGDFVIGIMSKIKECGVPPAVYTRVGPYSPWIFKFAGQQPPSGGWQNPNP